MSSPQPSQREMCVRYVARALQQNPLEDSALIIRRRNRLLGLEKKGKAPAEKAPAADPRILRQSLLEQIDSIRGDFWTTPLPELKASLRKLSAKEFPDIQAVVDRLSLVANHRDRIPPLTSRKGFHGGFFKVFKEVLVAAPRDSAIAKERMLAQFGKYKVRKRGSKMIRLIERELPALYQLESQWMKSLVKQKNQSSAVKTSVQPAEDSSGSFSMPWWVILVILAVIRVIVRTMGD